MYRCEDCERVIGPRVRAHRRVVERRGVLLSWRPRRWPVPTLPPPRIQDLSPDAGTQIVREITCCPDCA
jgi:hypothetical protein